tara:strand:+ start:439 stop:816 length:378 start_codon:yes stop_codon:yes gene_type:complete
MQSAFDNIKETYDLETCKEIVSHGCESGVCSQHIYYADTVKFFETYEDEIQTHVTESLGEEVLTELFKKAKGSLTNYKNNLVWTFIELVAMSIVDAKEEQERKDDLTIEGYNPARSMSMSRYANV